MEGEIQGFFLIAGVKAFEGGGIGLLVVGVLIKNTLVARL